MTNSYIIKLNINYLVPGQVEYKRHLSMSDANCNAGEESNILRKVTSLILDRSTLENRIVKPKFVPEKLDFKIYEKFEGKP